ncbi:hypothetical protein B0H13DRAFT_2310252 [Mycena leptocephala]|nr:hypothetical protein B0H13DRAFT_2310252 [Mycena leptocephala]
MSSANPSRSSSPHIDDDDDDYENLMSNVTPSSSPTRKRTANDAQLDDNDPELPPPVHWFSSPTGIIFVTEVEAFVNDPPAMQLAKLFVTVKANENMLANSKPQASSRSVIKKEIVKSVEVSARRRLARRRHRPFGQMTAHNNLPTHQNITHKLCGGKSTSIPITPSLCSRVALMRKWHVKKVENTVNDPDTADYSELVDKDLQKIRSKARKGTTDADEIAKRVARAFASILDKDHPDATATTDEAGMAYQADIDEVMKRAIVARVLVVMQNSKMEGRQLPRIMEAQPYGTQLPTHLNKVCTKAYTVVKTSPSHRIRTLLHDTIANSPKSTKFASILHLVERVPGTHWPSSAPARGHGFGLLTWYGTHHTCVRSTLADPPSGHHGDPIEGECIDIALADTRRRGSTWYTEP